MTDLTPKTLQDLHRVRESIAKEQMDRSAHQRVEETRREADALLKRWNLSLKLIASPKAPFR